MSAQLDILTFHRIMPRGENYFIPPMAMGLRTFTRLIERLASAKRVVGLEEGIRQLNDGEMQGRKIAITFDDGYLDNFEVARDVLLRVGVPATFFVPIKPIDEQTPYWWDYLHEVMARDANAFFNWGLRRDNPPSLIGVIEAIQTAAAVPVGKRCRAMVQALNALSEAERGSFVKDLTGKFGSYRGERLLMTWDEIRRLQSEGFAIGSHSVSHIPLTDLDLQAARREIEDSATMLYERTGERPAGFCFPRGAFAKEHANLVAECGYVYAVTTRFGGNTIETIPFSLSRRNMADYEGIRALFPVAMHLFELSGRLDGLLAMRRTT